MTTKLILAAAALALATSAYAAPRMTGMAEIAAHGDAEELRGIGWGRSERFTLASSGAKGTFRRTVGKVTDLELNAYIGTVDFSLAGPGIDGELSGSCGYEQETTEADATLSRTVRLDVGVVTAPFVYSCLFFRDGQPIGELELKRQAGRTVDIRALRSGWAEANGVVLALQSVHTFAGSRMPTEMPLGYTMARMENGDPGPDLAAAYLNGNTRHLVLPRQREERETALLASLALALLWDPGDGD